MRLAHLFLASLILGAPAGAKSAFWNGPGNYLATCTSSTNCALRAGPFLRTSECLRQAAAIVAKEEADDEYIGAEYRCIYLDKEPPKALEFDPS